MKTALFVVLTCVVLMFLFPGGCQVEAHEGGPNDVKHMDGDSSRVIGQKNCPGFQVWYHDKDHDGVVDSCSGYFLVHDKVYLFPVKLTTTPGCSCEPLLLNQTQEVNNNYDYR